MVIKRNKLYLLSRSTVCPSSLTSRSFLFQKVGNPSAYGGQAGGNEAGSHCSVLESQVLSEGAATALFQIIVARQEC